MRVVHVTLFVVDVPLRHPFEHASYVRHSSQNVIVRCRLANGIEGWGEGVPREYVTGETVETAWRQLANCRLEEQFAADCGDWSDVFQLCRSFQPQPENEDPRGCASNSLRCAVELSVLDAYARLFDCPLSEVTRHYERAADIHLSQDTVRYSSTIAAQAIPAARWSALKMRVYGFRQCKIKVGVAGSDDAARLRVIRRWIGRRIDLRLDANEAWPADQLLHLVEPLRGFGISCLEQPVPHAELDALGQLRPQLGVPVMLDESLTSMLDAETAIRQKACDLFNLRLSKCGGFLACLDLAAKAQAAGVGYQLGCHPGETGILSAAGRHFACSVRDIRYLEGSYDRHLLRQNFLQQDITFGYGGSAPALLAPGLGVQVDAAQVERSAILQLDRQW